MVAMLCHFITTLLSEKPDTTEPHSAHSFCGKIDMGHCIHCNQWKEKQTQVVECDTHCMDWTSTYNRTCCNNYP